MLRRFLQISLAAALPWVLLTLSACGGDGMTTPIRVCGTFNAADLDVVQVRVNDNDGREILSAVAASAASGEPITLPIETEIPASEGIGYISVEGRSAGLLAVRYTLRVRDLATIEPLSFPLDSECARFDCPEGETCIAGTCEMAPLPERSPECP